MISTIWRVGSAGGNLLLSVGKGSVKGGMQDAFYSPLNHLKQHGKFIHTVGFFLPHAETCFF